MIKRACLLVCLLLLPRLALAEAVQMEVRSGIRAGAEYLHGQPAKPAVLLLHGFLQTHNFPTLASLARGLHDAGYTTLTPTLSLGIPGRKQSLACEALHRHTLEDDVSEIALWVNWLKSHGHRDIVLAGHSFGSMQLLAYLSGKYDPAIRGYVGASLVETQMGEQPRARLIESLKKKIKQDDRGPVSGRLSFCKKFFATPSSLLSYARWDQSRTLAALRAYHGEKLLIMGGADDRLGHRWLKTLKDTGVRLIVVEGASHFLDGEHEFDLLDGVLSLLVKLTPSPRGGE